MDARKILRVRRACAMSRISAVLTLATVVMGVGAQVVEAASYRTQHFIVTAPTADYAREVGDTAEKLRHDLAMQWLGRELPPWRDICPIEVMPIEGAGGVTQFYFDRGQPYGWTMRVQGSRARVLDSVLPHEITHTIFATHFGRPLPRWADEGACTTTEDYSERRKQEKLLVDFLRTNRGIPFNRMFEMTEYPADVLPLYAQGYSLARFLIALKGRQTFINFVGDGLKTKQWGRTVTKHYGYADISELQVQWNRWVARGGQEQIVMEFAPASARPAAGAIAADTASASRTPATPVAPGPIEPVTGPHFDALVSAPGPTTPLAGLTKSPAPKSLPSVPPTNNDANSSPLPSASTVPTSTVPTSAVSTSASGAPQPGWYSRRRDEHRRANPHLMAERASQPKERPVVIRPTSNSGSASLASSAKGGASTSSDSRAINVSRPQPPQAAQQVILEWSRSSNPAPVYR